MKKGTLTRDQAIAICGKASVDSVENKNCDFTNRVGYNGNCQGDDEVEFSASLNCLDLAGDDCTITVFYYQEADDVDKNELDNLKWIAHGYEVD